MRLVRFVVDVASYHVLRDLTIRIVVDLIDNYPLLFETSELSRKDGVQYSLNLLIQLFLVVLVLRKLE